MNGSMLSDAIATTIGEVNAGGRMGLAAVFCGLFFFVAMLLTH